MGTIAELIASLRSTLPHSQSPLPWMAHPERGDVSASNNCGVAADIEQENAVYIAAAVNAVGPLIDEVERLRAENEKLRQRFRWIPVAEQLPEVGVDVMAWSGEQIPCFLGTTGWCETRVWAYQNNITHWRHIDKAGEDHTSTATTVSEAADA